MQELEKILEEMGNIQFASYTKPLIAVEDVIKIIRKHMNDGWIPCEERLPEDGQSVLCTDGKYAYLVEYDADLDAGFGDMDDIIAWQPLPEPYRPEKGGNTRQ